MERPALITGPHCAVRGPHWGGCAVKQTAWTWSFLLQYRPMTQPLTFLTGLCVPAMGDGAQTQIHRPPSFNSILPIESDPTRPSLYHHSPLPTFLHQAEATGGNVLTPSSLSPPDHPHPSSFLCHLASSIDLRDSALCRSPSYLS